MSRIVVAFCLLLLLLQGVEGVAELVVEERSAATVTCDADDSMTVFWIRLKENGQGFEYIATFSKTKKSGTVVDSGKFSVMEKSLAVKRFEQQKDSGTYSCVFINNNKLQFIHTTKLRGKTVPTTIKPKVQTAPMQTVASTRAAAEICPQNTKVMTSGNIEVLLGCKQQILFPLAAGCGFLLLLLLFTIFYCNRIRTRRCPHHYKKQPRSRPAGHKTLPNPPDY